MLGNFWKSTLRNPSSMQGNKFYGSLPDQNGDLGFSQFYAPFGLLKKTCSCVVINGQWEIICYYLFYVSTSNLIHYL